MLKLYWMIHIYSNGWTNQHVGIHSFTGFDSRDIQWNRFANMIQIAKFLSMEKPNRVERCAVDVQSTVRALWRRWILFGGFRASYLKRAESLKADLQCWRCQINADLPGRSIDLPLRSRVLIFGGGQTPHLPVICCCKQRDEAPLNAEIVPPVAP